MQVCVGKETLRAVYLSEEEEEELMKRRRRWRKLEQQGLLLDEFDMSPEEDEGSELLVAVRVRPELTPTHLTVMSWSPSPPAVICFTEGCQKSSASALLQ